MACWGTKAAISLKRVKIEEKLLRRRVCRKSQRSFDFLGHRHISTSGFASTATETAVFDLFLPVQPSDFNQWDCLHEGH